MLSYLNLYICIGRDVLLEHERQLWARILAAAVSETPGHDLAWARVHVLFTLVKNEAGNSIVVNVDGIYCTEHNPGKAVLDAIADCIAGRIDHILKDCKPLVQCDIHCVDHCQAGSATRNVNPPPPAG